MFQILLQILSKSWPARNQQPALEQQEITATEHKDGLERLIALKQGVRLRKALKTNFQQTSALNRNQGKSLRENPKRVLRQSQYRMQAASIAAQTTIQSFSGSWEVV
jgi:hypothetical protein